ncbi:DUF4352 domain-containing protein [Streptomyces sp. NPDC002701]|uniref:DUF4352 domain-containing protein n=1 Tax=Streptomyces sp. NPDC002701 TaxID=3364661 RepID=UPI0036A11098
MSQQYPQRPEWGQQPQQQGQPGWGAPPPPPKKHSTGKIVGIGCAGVFALLVILGIFGAALGGGSDDSGKDNPAAATEDTGAAAEADERDAPKKEKEEAAPESPVKVTAEKTTFKGSVLADGDDYTSVAVTVTNNSDESIDVNPLYFAITDSKGTKHSAELGADENQIDTVELAPGENVSGSVTGKGRFTPKYVTYTDGLIGDSIRSNVS